MSGIPAEYLLLHGTWWMRLLLVSVSSLSDDLCVCVCVWECVCVCWEDCGSPWVLWRLSLRFWQLRGIRKQGWGFLSQVWDACEVVAAPQVFLPSRRLSCSLFLRFGERRDCVVVESRPCQCHSTGSSSEVTERMKQRLFPEGRGGISVFITHPQWGEAGEFWGDMQRLNPRIHINELHVPQETEPPGCFRSANELKVSRPRQL